MNKRKIVILIGLFLLVWVVMGYIVTPSEVMKAIDWEARVAATPREWRKGSFFSDVGCKTLSGQSEVQECIRAFYRLRANYPTVFVEEAPVRTDYRIIWELASEYDRPLDWILTYQWDYNRGGNGVRSAAIKQKSSVASWNNVVGFDVIKLEATNRFHYDFVARKSSDKAWLVPYRLWCQNESGEIEVAYAFLSDHILDEFPCDVSQWR
ncbi:MAG: hypothetical protein ACPG8W_01920 [Candidatus Promineifilaceae bacterium]